MTVAQKRRPKTAWITYRCPRCGQTEGINSTIEPTVVLCWGRDTITRHKALRMKKIR